MPRLVQGNPKYRRHRASGQAVVTLNGRDHYLGPYGTQASRAEYDRLIGEWLTAGRRPVSGPPLVTVVELAAAYWSFAEGYYRKDGKATRTLERVKISLRLLKQRYALTPAAEFGPLALQSLQQAFVAEGKARPYNNHLIEQIRRVFKWGASQELVPASVFHGLATVSGLRKGRTEAREPAPILPVPSATVEATLSHLPEVVRDMVRFQQLTGCRPGEVCSLRPQDVDRTGDVWEYRPASHKTEHHGRQRVVFIGPQAQEVLSPYLVRDAAANCFSPAESERKRLGEKHAKRKTPLSCGNRPGTNRRRRRKRPPGDHYTPCA
jgi:integrase